MYKCSKFTLSSGHSDKNKARWKFNRQNILPEKDSRSTVVSVTVCTWGAILVWQCIHREPLLVSQGKFRKPWNFQNMPTMHVLWLCCIFGAIPYKGNILWVKTFTNFTISGQFTKVLTAKTFIEYGSVIINGCVINLNNSDSVGTIDVASQDPLACKAVFVQQQLPKPPCRHGSLGQQLPLHSPLAYSFCSHQFNLVRRFLPTHYCCFPQFAKILIAKILLSAIHESFHLWKILLYGSLQVVVYTYLQITKETSPITEQLLGA